MSKRKITLELDEEIFKKLEVLKKFMILITKDKSAQAITDEELIEYILLHKLKEFPSI